MSPGPFAGRLWRISRWPEHLISVLPPVPLAGKQTGLRGATPEGSGGWRGHGAVGSRLRLAAGGKEEVGGAPKGDWG